MNKRNRKSSILLMPVITVFIITILVMIISSVLSMIGFQGQKTGITNGGLETSLTTINNIFSLEGIQFIFGHAVTNLQIFEPLVLLIMSCIGVGILYKSGLLKELIKPLKKLNNYWLSFFVIITGLILTFFGEYSFILLIPLIGVVYKKLDKSPMLGIITVFLGVTLGYGSGILYNYEYLFLGYLTEEAARVNVDPNYEFESLRTLYITIAGSIVYALSLAYLINKRLANKFPKYQQEEQEKLNTSSEEEVEINPHKKSKLITSVVSIVLLIILIYSIIPGYQLSGVLLDVNQETYIEQLLSPSSAFQNGFVYILILFTTIIGYVYGRLSKNYSSANDFSNSMSFSFNNLGYLFVLLLLLSQLIGILNWTNLGEVLAVRIIELLSILEFSGILLIIAMFIGVVLISLIVPSTLTKWLLMAPIIVPLFMRSNITPDFTQYIFGIADGIGKSMTPIFIYFIIMIGFLNKYNQSSEYKVTIFGTLRMMLPIILLITGLWLLIIVGWYLIGLPLGVGGYSTL